MIAAAVGAQPTIVCHIAEAQKAVFVPLGNAAGIERIGGERMFDKSFEDFRPVRRPPLDIFGGRLLVVPEIPGLSRWTHRLRERATLTFFAGAGRDFA